jgi:cytochrome c
MSRFMTLAFTLFLAFVLVSCGGEGGNGSRSATSIGNAERGQQMIAQYGCNVCHVSPGVRGPQGKLGPSFERIARRRTISNGKVPNTPENLVRFIQSPASLNPQSAMPPMGVSPVDAQDMTAYLLTLR